MNRRFTFYFDLGLIFFSTVLLKISLGNYVDFTFDSDLYVSGAQHLKENGLSNIFDLDSFKSKPILYPLTLSVVGTSKTSITWLNIVCFAAIITTGCLIINSLFNDRFFSGFNHFWRRLEIICERQLKSHQNY